MKSEILKILRDADGYVSGQSLSDTLQVSRTAIWKAVNHLKEQGYQIEAVQKKGYHLIESPDMMSASEVESHLKTKWLGRKLLYKEEVDSTNTWAKRIAEEGAMEGTVTLADLQTQGKGRRGRIWQAPKGSTVMMTMILRPDILPEQASMLTIVMGLSTAQAVKEELGIDVQIKWPNDVVLSNKKICGILTEMSTQITSIDYVISGVGINVNTQHFPEEIAQKATSLAKETGQTYRRAPLAARVLLEFEHNYEIFLKTGDLSGLVEPYNNLLINKGKRIKVLQPQGDYEATSHGINEKGELIVEKEDGEIIPVFAGEVSVRGLYGYAD